MATGANHSEKSMSDQKEAPEDTRTSGTEPDAEDNVAAEEAQGEQAEGEAARGEETARADRAARGGSGLLVAWLALVVALAAAGGSAWQWWQQRTGDPSSGMFSRIEQQAATVDSHGDRLNELTARLEAIESRLERLAGRVESNSFDPATLREGLRDQSRAAAELRNRLDSLSDRLDTAVSDLEGRVERAGAARSDSLEEALANARYRLGLIEVSGLLRLAQARAGTGGDPVAALAAYRQAQARLEAMNDGRLDRLRELVAGELEALRAMEVPDWPTLTGRLAALETELVTWPAAGGDASRSAAPTSSPAESTATGEEDGWWSNLGHSLSGLVRVTPREAAPLTPAALESVRERIRLHLAAAQAAAARRSAATFAQQAESAAALIREHFDTSAEAVSSALGTLSEAASLSQPAAPDLGKALAEVERRLAAS
jgi:uroporphyrin-3 C-methyltransferase